MGFNDELLAIGGVLGLFTGVSILSIAEVLCCTFKMIINSAKRCAIHKIQNEVEDF